MRWIKKLEEISQKKGPHDLGITIGNFDGVHTGHQQMLSSIIEDCEKNGLKLLLITFRPHPRQVLAPTDDYLINSYRERRSLLSELDVDFFYEVDFTRDFSTLGPQEFLDEYILKYLKVKKIYLGHDFAFGENKSGGPQFIMDYCKQKKIDFKMMPEYKSKETAISSSIIRSKIVEGKVEEAAQLLGRNYYIGGRVVKGVGRGKKIGFPTANLKFRRDRVVPSNGVYITKAKYQNETFFSITNVGLNPTFCDENKKNIETHILDFDKDIYGEELTVSFYKKIREEKKFSSAKELVKQIKLDIKKARGHFKL